MQRSLIFAAILLLAALAAGVWFFFGGQTTALPAAPNDPIVENVDGGPGVQTASGAMDNAGAPVAIREAAATDGAPLLADPDIRAGLCGFRGRVVTHAKEPVGDCGVRLYRGAMDSVLSGKFDLLEGFGEGADLDKLAGFDPDFIAAEVRTEADGTFEITEVWPRAFFLLFSGIDTDAPTWQLVGKSPSPGEIVDLGDVVLNDAGILTGTVYSDEGEPLADALVRAADIPGTLAAFFPAERFDPQGVVLVRERRAPISVIELPPWVKKVFDNLPIPSTRTDDEGYFRLVGVSPGSNLLATTAEGYLSDLKPSVIVRPGVEKDVGRIRLRQGEELYAIVRDEQGKPVAGAEVVAGSTLSMVPFDFGRRLGKTNELGEIDGYGFAPGRVTVAARRTPDEAWVRAEPQQIISDVIVTLPSRFAVTASVRLAGGAPAEGARLQLLRGKAGNGAAEMVMLGFMKPVPLQNRLERLEDGGYRIAGLHRGQYTLLADVPGSATGSQNFEIVDADANVSVELAEPDVFAVRVVNQDQEPVRNVAITAKARGERSVMKMPVQCGRTGKDGTLSITRLSGEKLRISADHPRWGTVNGETDGSEELVLTMLEPGAIRGVLTENGETPEPGKWSIAVMWRRNGGPRGALDSVPQLTAAALDGSFEVTGLQPGTYRVASFNSIEAIRSPGSVMQMGQSMFLSGNLSSQTVDVVSGQVAEVQVDCGKKPIEGPTARVFGSVMVDGRAGKDHVVTGYTGGRRFAVEVDERGRFDLEEVGAGDMWISVYATQDGVMIGGRNMVWSDQLELKEAEQRELVIDVMTSSISGNCYLPDGSPARGARVRAVGTLAAASGSPESGNRRQRARLNTQTDDRGAFSLRGVAEGQWQINVSVRLEGARWKAPEQTYQVTSALPQTGLRIELAAQIEVAGRVDLSSLPKLGEDADVWLMFQRVDGVPDVSEDMMYAGVRDNGSFSSNDFVVGRYRPVLHVEDKQYPCDELVVPASGLKDLVLTPRQQ
ncbi:MAG: hypothetical protein AB8H80_03585 [Planctomycetota bacterium]